MKHKGKDHKIVSKSINKSKFTPPARQSLESQAPQVPKPGTNAQNQFR